MTDAVRDDGRRADGKQLADTDALDQPGNALVGTRIDW
jgi:hypothetical protein